MATIHNPTAAPEPYLPPVDPDDLRRRNAETIAMLDRWATEGDEQEQRETMAVLRLALGADRVISDRPQFP